MYSSTFDLYQEIPLIICIVFVNVVPSRTGWFRQGLSSQMLWPTSLQMVTFTLKPGQYQLEIIVLYIYIYTIKHSTYRTINYIYIYIYTIG